MLWFKSKTRADQKKALENIDSRLGQLEQTLHELIKHSGTYEITIEELNIHDPTLDSLTFRFDKLDVKEVSGALNLGNNFGVDVHQGDNKKSKDKSSESLDTGSRRDQPKVNIVRDRKKKSKKADIKSSIENLTKKAQEKAKKKGQSKPKNQRKNKDDGIKINFQPINKYNDDH